jgi:hypothetical protein
MELQNELKKITEQYNADPTSDKTNFILYGGMGTGKTTALLTTPTPLLVYSFDPGGTDVFPSERIGKDIFVERFESEDAKHPTEFERWEKRFDELRKTDFFKQIGTLAIDSATTWGDALMNAILKKQGRAGGVPQLQDYMIAGNSIRDLLKIFTGLPCNCVLTAHVDVDKDEVSGRMKTAIMITGKLKVKIPLLFGEIYVTISKQTKDGISYSFLTRPDGLYEARTRIGAGNKFDVYEKPDLMYLLKKSGKVK